MGNNLKVCRDKDSVDKTVPDLAIEIQKLRVYKQHELLIYYQGLTGETREKFRESIMSTNMDPLDYVF